MNKISIIIPIHEFNKDIKVFFDKLLDSIGRQTKKDKISDINIVYGKNVNIEKLNIYTDKYGDLIPVNFIRNDDSDDYQSQVNLAVEHIKSEYFTVIEFDDELAETYVKNMCEHIDSYNETDIFMPMIIEVNNEGEGIKLTNEVVWSQQFVGENGEVGYLNPDILSEMTDFKLSGAIIKKDIFKSAGGYKTNIKLTFMYEFLLRVLNNGYKIYTVPKILYKHLNGRKDSLFDMYSKNMSMKERKFWFEVATKEYNFNTDRVIDTSELKTV